MGTRGQPVVEAERDRITSPVNVTAMRDVDDPNDNSVVEDLVDHPEFAPPGRVSTLQLVAKRLSDAIRTFRERTSNELPARHGHRQEIGQRILRSFRQLNLIGQRGSRPVARISSVTSSSV